MRNWSPASVRNLSIALFVVALAFQDLTHAQLYQPEANPLPRFEVATIKPSRDAAPEMGLSFRPEHFVVTYGSVRDLLRFAYRTKSDDQIVGAPAWIDTKHYDIQAKAESPEIDAYKKLSSQGDMERRIDVSRTLVQSLLHDRFHLKTHIETRELTVYKLVVAKGGPKMTEVKADPFPGPGETPPRGAHLTSYRVTGTNQRTATALPMKMFADFLSHSDEMRNRIVIDETGLQGKYDFTLNGISVGGPQNSAADSSATGEPTISLGTALKQQLGLELKPAKARVEVLVVDQVDEPSAN